MVFILNISQKVCHLRIHDINAKKKSNKQKKGNMSITLLANFHIITNFAYLGTTLFETTKNYLN